MCGQMPLPHSITKIHHREDLICTRGRALAKSMFSWFIRRGVCFLHKQNIAFVTLYPCFQCSNNLVSIH